MGQCSRVRQNISQKLKNKLKNAFSKTSIIAESVFIFSKGELIQLKEISKDGVWCTLIGESHGKHVIRILVQLKNKKAYIL